MLKVGVLLAAMRLAFVIPKIRIENAVLPGSPQDAILQRVATIYVGTHEYCVYAPPRATGSALEWVENFIVHQRSDSGMGENEVNAGDVAYFKGLVKEKLEELMLDADIWRHPDTGGRYCAAQICLRGHAQSVDGHDFAQEAHCPKCGEPCIDRCRNCKAPIHGKEVYSSADYVLPFYCYKCGQAYPWMEDRLQTAKELLRHDDKLTLEERERLWGLLQYVMSDPKSDMAPAKKKLFEIGIAKALPATREFLLDFMAKLGAEMLKP